MSIYFTASSIFLLTFISQLALKFFYFNNSLFFEQNASLNLFYILLCILAVALGEIFAQNGKLKLFHKFRVSIGSDESSRSQPSSLYLCRFSRFLASISLAVFLLQLYILFTRYSSVGSLIAPGELRALLNTETDLKLPVYFYIFRIVASSSLSLLVLSFTLRSLILSFYSYSSRLRIPGLRLCNLTIIVCLVSSFPSFLEGSRNTATVFSVFFLLLLSISFIPSLVSNTRLFLGSGRVNTRTFISVLLLLLSMLILLYLFDIVGSQRSTAFYGEGSALDEVTNSLYSISGVSDRLDNPTRIISIFYLTHSLDRISDILSNYSTYIFPTHLGSNILLIPYRVFCSIGIFIFCASSSSAAPGYIDGLFHGAIGDLLLDFGFFFTPLIFFGLGCLHSISISRLIKSSPIVSSKCLLRYLASNVSYVSLSSLFVLSPLYLLYGGATFIFLPQALFFVFFFPLLASLVTKNSFLRS